MECVTRFGSRHSFLGNQGIRQIINLIRRLQKIQVLDDFKTFGRHRWITFGTFFEDDLRNE